MIYSFQPYDQNGNLADAYNRHCELVPNDNDWIVIRDADVMMLTPGYETVMKEYVEKYPEYELFTVYTNRVKCRPQLVKEMFFEERLSKHREKAVELFNTKRHSVKEIHRVISGYLMMFQKKTWKKHGGFKGKGITGIDTKFSRDVLSSGGRIGLMEAVYAFHYYKWNENISFNPYKSARGQKG